MSRLGLRFLFVLEGLIVSIEMMLLGLIMLVVMLGVRFRFMVEVLYLGVVIWVVLCRCFCCFVLVIGSFGIL